MWRAWSAAWSRPGPYAASGALATRARRVGPILGRLPGGFTITFPKVVMAEHVAIFAEYLERLEAALGLPAGILRFEVQVETTEAIIDHEGRVGLRAVVDAAHDLGFTHVALEMREKDG